MSTETRSVTIFSAGCPVCVETIADVRERACPSCEVEVLDMHRPAVADRARSLGVGALPAVAIDGELVACCEAGGPDMKVLEEKGLGEPLD